MHQRSKLFPRPYMSLLGGAIATTAISLLTVSQGYASPIGLQDSPKVVLDEAWQIVNREFVDPDFHQQNWQMARQRLLSRNYTSREQAYAALHGELEKLGDPYTRFLDPKQYQSLTSQTSGELSGVGLRLGMDEKSQRLIVVEPIEDSPAVRAGLQPGDLILSIDGQTTEGMTVEAAAKLIRGDVGTEVVLRFERSGEAEKSVSLTRARIELPAVRTSLRQEGNLKVGYIRLNEFSSHASTQMRRAIRELVAKDADAFVLDLRGNPGGLLHASIEIARMWLQDGSIVSTVDRDKHNENVTANHTALTELPLAVLVDGNSASASEILAGALQDNDRAVVIGTHTFGKALVQSVHSLSDGSGLAVTIAHYYTPSGTDISRKGIQPDVMVNLSETQLQKLTTNPQLIGTIEDPHYAQAVHDLLAKSHSIPVATKSEVPSAVK